MDAHCRRTLPARHSTQTAGAPTSTIMRRNHEPCRCCGHKMRLQHVHTPPVPGSKRAPHLSQSIVKMDL